MAFTTINKSTDYFNTKLYTGNAGTQAITGVGFQPDWVWIKNRNSATEHSIFDAVRGATYRIASNNTDAQSAQAAELTAFGSDGFTTGNAGGTNGSGNGIVAWNWKANGQGSSNTDGSINTTYTSVNTTSAFSISKYTGTGSNATVGHGIGVKPSMILVKRLDSTGGWLTYHSSVGATKYLELDSSGGSATNSTIWQDTEPTSSVFSISTNASVNGSSGTFVAYCFAEKQGYSKFGSYVGNGSTDGTFVYTGFKPAWIMFKDLRSGQSWNMYDNKRSPINFVDERLRANLNGAEVQDTGSSDMDFVSNGFKLRNNWDQLNSSGQTIIYMAFAAAPLVGTNNIPANAR